MRAQDLNLLSRCRREYVANLGDEDGCCDEIRRACAALGVQKKIAGASA
jgi:hypothetical protein